MNWLALVLLLEMGWLPHGGFALYDPSFPPEVEQVLDLQGSFYTALGARVYAWDHLFAGGSVKTYVWGERGETTFWPHAELYMFEAGLEWAPLTVGWRHYCMHPVMPWLTFLQPAMRFEGAYDEVYLQVGGRVGR